MNPRLALATLGLLLLAPLGALVAAPPRAGMPVIVFVPPWLDAEQIVARAGGQVLGPESAPLAVLAYSDSPDFSQDLLRSGAFGVRDGALIANLCNVEV